MALQPPRLLTRYLTKQVMNVMDVSESGSIPGWMAGMKHNDFWQGSSGGAGRQSPHHLSAAGSSIHCSVTESSMCLRAEMKASGILQYYSR